MKKGTKKGFTLVELVIVIAVIAVLSAIIIPVTGSIVSNAKETVDKTTVKALNTALAQDEAKNGARTLYSDVIDAMAEYGYGVDKLTPLSLGDILWDSQSNTFVLYKDGEEVMRDKGSSSVDKVNLWRVAKNKDDLSPEYSNYLADNFNDKTVSVHTGVDVGNNKGLNISYSSSASDKNVIINTNGGDLSVAAPNAAVTHYGVTNKVTIESVAPHSYYENGTVEGNLEIKQGKVEFTKTAVVNTLVVSATTQNAVQIVFASNEANVGTVAATTDAAQKIINDTTVPETTEKTENVVNITKDFAGGLGTEKSPYLVANEEQWNKIAANAGKYFKQINDLKVSERVEKISGGYDGNGYQLTTEDSHLFNEIIGHTTFKNINVIMDKNTITLLCFADWATTYGATFENITFNGKKDKYEVNSSNFGLVVTNALYTPENSEMVTYIFKDITNNVSIENIGTSTGFIIGSGPCFNSKAEIKYENCVNNAMIIGGAQVGFLYGNPAYIDCMAETNSTITVNNCVNKSILLSVKDNAKVAFALNLPEVNDKYQALSGGSYISDNYLKNADLKVGKNGNSFAINANDDYSYKLVFSVAATYYTKDGSAWTDKHTAVAGTKDWDSLCDVSNGLKYAVNMEKADSIESSLGEFYAYDVNTAKKMGVGNSFSFNSEKFVLVEKDGKTYLVFNTDNTTYINSKVTVYVYAYNNNSLIGIKEVK